MEILPNSTLFIQLAIYIALIFVLKVLFYDPILALLRKRESLTTGRQTEADTLVAKSAELQKDYDSRMAKLRSEFENERAAALKRARDLTDSKMKDLKAEIDKKLAASAKELEAEVSKAKKQVPEISAGIAKEMVDALLNSKVVRA